MTKLKKCWKEFVKFLKSFADPTPGERADFLIGKIKDSGKIYQCGIQPSKPWPRASGYSPEQPSNVPDMPNPPPPPPTPEENIVLRMPTPKLLTRIPKDMYVDFQDLLKYISGLNSNWIEIKTGKFTAKNNDDWVDITINDI
jgi:hypothetical protein